MDEVESVAGLDDEAPFLWYDPDEPDAAPRGTMAPRLTSVERMVLDIKWREQKMQAKKERKRLKRKLQGRRAPRHMPPLVIHRPSVAIDMSFCDMLPEREQRSVMSQASGVVARPACRLRGSLGDPAIRTQPAVQPRARCASCGHRMRRCGAALVAHQRCRVRRVSLLCVCVRACLRRPPCRDGLTRAAASGL